VKIRSVVFFLVKLRTDRQTNAGHYITSLAEVMMKMELNMMNMLHMLKTGRRERRPVALITTENSNACVHQKRLVHANSTSRQISCWRYAVYSISSRAALARLTKRYCRRVTNVPWPGGSHMSSILVPGNSVRDSAGRRCDERTDARAVVQPVPTCRFN